MDPPCWPSAEHSHEKKGNALELKGKDMFLNGMNGHLLKTEDTKVLKWMNMILEKLYFPNFVNTKNLKCKDVSIPATSLSDLKRF